MHEVIFYPIGNGDTCLMRLESGKRVAFDFADLHDPSDKSDKRMPLARNFRDDLGWPKVKEIDVLAITHGDIDHVKYQGPDRIRIKEMWVPASLIVEEGSEDDTKTVRQEARHRFLNRKGIRVFSRPEHLRDWLKENGKRLEDFQDLITDAGRTVPGWDLAGQGVEFFVHSPFAERDGDALLDRNGNCLVLQAEPQSSAPGDVASPGKAEIHMKGCIFKHRLPVGLNALPFMIRIDGLNIIQVSAHILIPA